MEGIATSWNAFDNVPPGKKREGFLNAECIGGPHLYTALQLTFLDVPGYTQVNDYATGSAANLSDC